MAVPVGRRTRAPRGSTPTAASTRRDRAAGPRRPALPGDPADPPDEAFPLILTTGRIASQWHTMTRTAKSAELMAAEPEPFIALHPADARRAWVGERARVVSRRGAVVLKVRLDATLREGTAFAPFHWGALHAPRRRGRRQRPHAPRDRPGVAPARPEGDRDPRRAGAGAPQARTKRVLIVGAARPGVATAEHAARARRLRDHARQRASPGSRTTASGSPTTSPATARRPTSRCTTSAGTASAASSAAARSSTPATAWRGRTTGDDSATTRSSWPPARARSCRRSRASSGRSRSAPATTSARSAGAPTARAARS